MINYGTPGIPTRVQLAEGSAPDSVLYLNCLCCITNNYILDGAYACIGNEPDLTC